MFGASALTFAQAADLTQIDRLTQQWLDIQRQTSQLVVDWQSSEPVLQQRVTLLSAEKKQLQEILNQSKDSQEDVTKRRTELLQQQSNLEQQQAALANKLSLLEDQVTHFSNLLPPPLQNAWAQQQISTSDDNDTSKNLQAALGKLNSLMDFQKRISVHEGPISLSSEGEVMVKQLYLGVSAAWFVSADGKLTGQGLVKDGQWMWVEDPSLSGDEIMKAIDIFERRKQADFIELPVRLTRLETPSGNAQ
ncbi:DUF3450 family protein [Alteromonas sp. 1_MG-2023]|uniref:DUF3450 family protein n=1 Tax=Alteromonas sp. 1_MG-2023 TaxID=3062669 RepID=UPI0026E4378A|nr:DUF3450 family protein [Alteromonas sp. 1_MG-2023]MDO6567707.1 DUF3450 family protein [Alteromonas sp. 1_MG-2023]